MCTRHSLTLRFKQKDRAFKKNDPKTLEFKYSEIDSVHYQSKFFGPKILTITTRNTDALKEFPGAEVAKVELHVVKDYRKAASEMNSYVDYQQSEVYLRERSEKLSDARDGLD